MSANGDPMRTTRIILLAAVMGGCGGGAQVSSESEPLSIARVAGGPRGTLPSCTDFPRSAFAGAVTAEESSDRNVLIVRIASGAMCSIEVAAAEILFAGAPPPPSVNASDSDPMPADGRHHGSDGYPAGDSDPMPAKGKHIQGTKGVKKP